MKIFAETERLLLREILPSDDKAMFELDADPQVHTYLGKKPVKDIEESRKIIEYVRQQYATNGIGRWAVIEKESKAFIGWSGLKYITEPINNHVHYYDLGYRFIRRYWGKGFAFESAKASVAYGFDILQVKEIYGMAEAGNIASQNVLKKTGLHYIDTFIWQGEQMYWYKIANTDYLK